MRGTQGGDYAQLTQGQECRIRAWRREALIKGALPGLKGCADRYLEISKLVEGPPGYQLFDTDDYILGRV
jgi:hypothetical protein